MLSRSETHEPVPMCISARVFSVLFLAAGLIGMVSPAQADVNPHERLQQHVRDVVQDVKSAQVPAVKRSILDDELRTMVGALDRIEHMTDLSEDEEAEIDALRSRLQEKIHELNGQNGYEAVPDGQLDAFADYVQQDFEQANGTITLGVGTALLIILLIVLLA